MGVQPGLDVALLGLLAGLRVLRLLLQRGQQGLGLSVGAGLALGLGRSQVFAQPGLGLRHARQQGVRTLGKALLKTLQRSVQRRRLGLRALLVAGQRGAAGVGQAGQRLVHLPGQAVQPRLHQFGDALVLGLRMLAHAGQGVGHIGPISSPARRALWPRLSCSDWSTRRARSVNAVSAWR